ncbi:MAG: TetR family transcriptional regulator [Demequinaceae bacterium]|nr:TetR family transcriptional regulator [Demequinaceae bacterium]
MTPRARGPRGGGADTRADILRAALTLFTQSGYDRTSIRAIAHAAGVDPSLPRHYIPSKPLLFVEAVGPFEGIDERIANILEGPRSGLGQRNVSVIINLWDSPDHGPRLRTLLTSAVASPEIGEVARSILFDRLILPLSRGVAPTDVEGRAAAVASQIFGLIATRYIFRIEPLVSASAQEVVDRFGPIIQRHITGESA